jgi:hypothetical protein
MEPEASLPYSQVPTSCLYPEPTPSSPHNPLQLPKNPPKSYPLIYVCLNYHYCCNICCLSYSNTMGINIVIFITFVNGVIYNSV